MTFEPMAKDGVGERRRSWLTFWRACVGSDEVPLSEGEDVPLQLQEGDEVGARSFHGSLGSLLEDAGRDCEVVGVVGNNPMLQSLRCKPNIMH